VTERATPDRRDDYRYFQTMTTRWMDNDSYRHMNNTTYYSFFDTIVNQYLIENGLLDVENGEVIGLVAETMCSYFKSLGFPSKVTVGLRVGRLGSSSVRYEIGMFREQDETTSAQGHFVHVYVDRASGRPVPLQDALRSAVSRLLVKEASGG
jgi:acyl-CoA thioester hydrolase